MLRAVKVAATTLALLWWATASAESPSELARIDAFLQHNQAQQAIRQLSPAEKSKLHQTLCVPNRTIPDRLIGKLLQNPVAWRPGPEGRELLRSVIDALPEVANVPGAELALKNACHPNPGNFRGYGFELVASAALMRYREPDGVNPRIQRMSAVIPGAKGKMYESDGCAIFDGADSRQRLVTMKSVSSERALKGAVNKAASQLAIRNGSLDPKPGRPIKPGVMMIGYSDPAVLQRARRKDWGAAASRTGAKLLVLAVNQLTGQVTRLASVAPSGKRSPELQQSQRRVLQYRQNRMQQRSERFSGRCWPRRATSRPRSP